MTTATRLIATYEILHAALITAQAERDQRPDLVTVNGQPECAWAIYERGVMLEQVNKIRADLGYQPVHMAAVERVENAAVGYSDYTKKYALYCAELALKETP